MKTAPFRCAALAAMLGLPACGGQGSMAAIPFTEAHTANTASRADAGARFEQPGGLRAMPGAITVPTPAPSTPTPSPAPERFQ